ncbi:hypothetical protein [Paenibacillus campi]|uniref:hypothetical protein n=1 Tax=Paenibacillus campi TaxID=3106031 RepID=UPI002AFE431E|nr:hypothetical protein [Paenibacillus sp. SGZ-1014]
MSETKPVMTVFAGTNGAGKSTLSMQMRDWLDELVDPDQSQGVHIMKLLDSL